MSDEEIVRLRAESSRGDYASMVRLARALHGAGLSPREVLHGCYGVDFPAELLAIAGARSGALPLLVIHTNQPWELAIPPARGGPRPAPHLLEAMELRILARDPDLMPLCLLLDRGSRWAGMALCYRLRELEAGRPAVFGIREDVEPGDDVVRCGDSLLAVLRDHHGDVLRQLEWEWRQPSNRGAGSVDAEEVAEVRSLVERIEALERRLTPTR
jgi:hypothetical protein